MKGDSSVKVKINGLAKGIIWEHTDIFDVTNISMDPEHRYAVLEIYPKELFAAVKVISDEGDLLICQYVAHYASYNDDPVLMKYIVNWDCMKYGFCKLILWAPEMSQQLGGRSYRTVKRFYFDWELYKTDYEKRYGVPCLKKKPPYVT